MGFLRRLLGVKPDHQRLQEAAAALHHERGELRKSVSLLGQDVWQLVETGDPLRALVHGAQNAQFRRDITDGANGD